MKAFADQLRAIQKKRNMTQAQLAKHLGISTSALSYYMLDKKSPTLNDAAKIADKLGMTIGQLCKERDTSDLEHLTCADVLKQLLGLKGTKGFSVRNEVVDEIPFVSVTIFEPNIWNYFEDVEKFGKLRDAGIIDCETYNTIMASKRSALESIPFNEDDKLQQLRSSVAVDKETDA